MPIYGYSRNINFRMKKIYIVILLIGLTCTCFGKKDYTLCAIKGFYVRANIVCDNNYPLSLDFMADSTFLEESNFRNKSETECINYICQKYKIVPNLFFSYPFVFKQLYGISSQYEIDKFIYKTNKEFEKNEIKGNYKLENGFKLYYEYIKCYGIAYIPDKNSKLFKMDDSNSISYFDYPNLSLYVPIQCVPIDNNVKY